MDQEPESAARVVVNGEPVEGVDPLFIGTLAEARLFLRGLPPVERAQLSIFTPDRVYGPHEV